MSGGKKYVVLNKEEQRFLTDKSASFFCAPLRPDVSRNQTKSKIRGKA